MKSISSEGVREFLEEQKSTYIRSFIAAGTLTLVTIGMQAGTGSIDHLFPSPKDFLPEIGPVRYYKQNQ